MKQQRKPTLIQKLAKQEAARLRIGEWSKAGDRVLTFRKPTARELARERRSIERHWRVKPKTKAQMELMDEIWQAFKRLGAERHILRTIASYGRTLPDVLVLQFLREHNQSA